VQHSSKNITYHLLELPYNQTIVT